MVFESTRIGNSFFDEMKDRLDAQVWLDKNDKKDEEKIAIWYNFNLSKLDELAALGNQSAEVQRKFVSLKDFIETKNMLEKHKIETVLTAACVLNMGSSYFAEAPDSILFWFSICAILISPQDTERYKQVIDFYFDALRELGEPIEQEKGEQFTITKPKGTK